MVSILFVFSSKLLEKYIIPYNKVITYLIIGLLVIINLLIYLGNFIFLELISKNLIYFLFIISFFYVDKIKNEREKKTLALFFLLSFTFQFYVINKVSIISGIKEYIWFLNYNNITLNYIIIICTIISGFSAIYDLFTKNKNNS